MALQCEPVRAYFKLLISFICQTVKGCLCGCVSGSPSWLMKKNKNKKKKSCSRAENQGNLGVGGIMALLWLEMLQKRNSKRTARRREQTGHPLYSCCSSARLSLCSYFYLTFSRIRHPNTKLQTKASHISHFRRLLSRSFTLHATEIWFKTQDRLRWNEG